MTTTSQLITDSQRLVSAKSRFGHVIPTYDDGFGGLVKPVHPMKSASSYSTFAEFMADLSKQSAPRLINPYGLRLPTVALYHAAVDRGDLELVAMIDSIWDEQFALEHQETVGVRATVADRMFEDQQKATCWSDDGFDVVTHDPR